MKNFSAKTNQTHFESALRFLALIAFIIGYFLYMSWKYDAATGAILAVLSWSFFVLCTPIADGGFVVAFPLRLLFGVRMVYTQIGVWILAVTVNVFGLMLFPQYYSDSAVTELLHKILVTPWPYWSILLISSVGTALSIWFGDEMMDVTNHSQREKHHKHGFKHRTLVILVFGVLTVLAYYQLLSDLGVQVPD
jgi:hypothetical protein